MNIGLQPQYPTLWWIDAVLAAIVLAGTITQLALAVVRARRARQKAEEEYRKDHAAWDKEKRNAVAIVAREGKEAEPWVRREPQFTMNSMTRPPTPWAGLTAAIAGGVLLIVGAVTIMICVPFDSRYYNFYVEKGTVGEVVSTVALGDDTVSNDFTFSLENDPRRFTITDPRIKTLQGQPVELLCSVGWNYQLADSWSCNLRGYEGGTR